MWDHFVCLLCWERRGEARRGAEGGEAFFCCKAWDLWREVGCVEVWYAVVVRVGMITMGGVIDERLFQNEDVREQRRCNRYISSTAV